jgi:hypothetical protein
VLLVVACEDLEAVDRRENRPMFVQIAPQASYHLLSPCKQASCDGARLCDDSAWFV